MVRVHQLQRLLDHPQRTFARPLLGLRRQKRLAPPLRHHPAVILLAPPIRAAINRRRIKIIHAQIQRPLNDRNGHIKIISLLQRRLPAKAEDANLVACLPQIARRHRRQRARIVRQRTKLFARLCLRRHRSLRQQSSRQRSTLLQKATTISSIRRIGHTRSLQVQLTPDSIPEFLVTARCRRGRRCLRALAVPAAVAAPVPRGSAPKVP